LNTYNNKEGKLCFYEADTKHIKSLIKHNSNIKDFAVANNFFDDRE
jgi:hypothetical protein